MKYQYIEKMKEKLKTLKDIKGKIEAYSMDSDDEIVFKIDLKQEAIKEETKQ